MNTTLAAKQRAETVNNCPARGRGLPYIRFSTPEQAMGDSERRQLAEAARYCERHGLRIVDAVKDKGVSAFHGKHREAGALGRLVKFAEPGDTIIIEDNDRWSRENPLDALTHLRAVVARGVQIVFLRTGSVITRDNFDDMGVMIPNFFGAFLANQESKKKGERVAAAWSAKRARAKTEKLTKMGPRWLRLSADRKSFEPIPERVAVVRRIFERTAAGEGLQTLAHALNAEGVAPLRKGKGWQSSALSALLRSRTVLGEFRPGLFRDGKRHLTGEVIENYYPAVISKALFARAHQQRRTYDHTLKGRHGGRRSALNVFAKMLFDEHGHTILMQEKSSAPGKSYRYLMSYGYTMGHCKYAGWRFENFRDTFLAVVVEATRRAVTGPSEAETKLAGVRLELEDTEKQIARLVDFLARGQAFEEVEAKLAALKAHKVEVQGKVRELETEAAARMPSDKIDWRDTAALRANLLATVKRGTVWLAEKKCAVELYNGRVYTFCTAAGGMLRITSPDPDFAKQLSAKFARIGGAVRYGPARASK